MDRHLTKCEWVNCILEQYGESKKGCCKGFEED